MNILPPSQIKNLPILEEVLEELRLNIIDHIYNISDALDLYSLDSEELKKKLNMLGLSNITVGKFLMFDLSQDEFEFISPEFYKMYRKLNQHRGNKMSMDYILHSGGMMNTLVKSNDNFDKEVNVFNNLVSFFDFSTYRDNQLPELHIGDGYIIVPYTEENQGRIKRYLALNPIIFKFIPAGYTFVFLSDYRNTFNNSILQYDNLLSYLDTSNKNYKELYWEVYDCEEVVIETVIDSNGNEVDVEHVLRYYDPFTWRDLGKSFFMVFDPRFTSDDLYSVPLFVDGVYYSRLEDYLDVYNKFLWDKVLEDVLDGYESDLNNTLNYKDIWLGDRLVPALKGTNRDISYPDHVKGLKSIQAPTYSYASLYNRGQSLASQYLQREEKVVSLVDEDKQENKSGIISDRRETDLFKFKFTDEDYSVWLLSTNKASASENMIDEYFGYPLEEIYYMVENIPVSVVDGLDIDQAYSIYNMLINDLPYEDALMTFCIKDSEGNIIISNDSYYTENADITQSFVSNHAHSTALSSTLPPIDVDT